jgi:hypothetical protein
MNPLASRHVTAVTCAKLRHKGMYAHADSHSEEEMALYRDPIPATAFWCACTQKNFGPDGMPVTAELCASGRGCCEH